MKTNLSRRILTPTIQGLIDKGLVIVTDLKGNVLSIPQQRIGRQYLYYGIAVRLTQITSETYAVSVQRPVHPCAHNKTKKEKETKGSTHEVLDIVESLTKAMQEKI